MYCETYSIDGGSCSGCACNGAGAGSRELTVTDIVEGDRPGPGAREGAPWWLVVILAVLAVGGR